MLRERLEAIGVEVSVETFEEDQGIAALGDDPFVSCKMVHVVRLVELATHCCTHEHVLQHGATNFNTAHTKYSGG